MSFDALGFRAWSLEIVLEPATKIVSTRCAPHVPPSALGEARRAATVLEPKADVAENVPHIANAWNFDADRQFEIDLNVITSHREGRTQGILAATADESPHRAAPTERDCRFTVDGRVPSVLEDRIEIEVHLHRADVRTATEGILEVVRCLLDRTQNRNVRMVRVRNVNMRIVMVRPVRMMPVRPVPMAPEV